jgi:IS30 family transposase
MGYVHLTKDERERILQFQAAGHSIAQIARALGRVASTLYREFKRNARPAGDYSARHAQQAYHQRRRASRRAWRIESDPELEQAVRCGLKQHWSPEQIAGRLRREHPRNPARHVGFKTIYRLIARDRAQGGTLWQALRQRGGHYRKRYGGKDRRGQIRDRRPMDQRPPIVERRARRGDFEGDTVCAGRSPALAVFVDRKSRYALLRPLRDGRAASLNRAARSALGSVPPCLLKTLTVDNGREFARHRALERDCGVKVYFAPPYQSWQRGTCENLNGLLREFIPKADRSKPDAKQVDRIERLLNNRPRKCLNWRTPREVFLPS